MLCCSSLWFLRLIVLHLRRGLNLQLVVQGHPTLSRSLSGLLSVERLGKPSIYDSVPEWEQQHPLVGLRGTESFSRSTLTPCIRLQGRLSPQCFRDSTVPRV